MSHFPSATETAECTDRDAQYREVGEMYRCRAEFEAEGRLFIEAAGITRFHLEPLFPEGNALRCAPDRLLTFTSDKDLGQLIRIAAKIVDNHVLAGTVPDVKGLHDFVVEGPHATVSAQSIGKWCVANSVINLFPLGFTSGRRLRAALENGKILANQKQDGLDKTNVLHLLFQVLRADLQNGHLYNLHAKKLAKAKHRGGLGKLAFLLAPCPADEGDNVGYLLVYGNHCVAVSRRKGCYFPSDPRVGKKRCALALKPGLFEALQIQEEDVKCVIRLESKAAAPRASKRAHGQVAKRAADALQPADQQAKRHRVC